MPKLTGRTDVAAISSGEDSEIEILIPVQSIFDMRVKVFNTGTMTVSTNATLSAVTDKSEIIKTHTAGKDLEFRSLEVGVLTINLNNTVQEQVDIRLGPAEFGPLIIDYSQVFTFGHLYLQLDGFTSGSVISPITIQRTTNIVLDEVSVASVIGTIKE